MFEQKIDFYGFFMIFVDFVVTSFWPPHLFPGSDSRTSRRKDLSAPFWAAGRAVAGLLRLIKAAYENVQPETESTKSQKLLVQCGWIHRTLVHWTCATANPKRLPVRPTVRFGALVKCGA